MYSIWNGQASRPAQTRTTASSSSTSSSSAAAAAAAAALTRIVLGAAGRGGLEDDDFVPFDPPIHSKYGPISRLSRILPRPSNPVQASAHFGHALISTQTVPRTPLSSTGENGGVCGVGGAGGGGGGGRDFYAESERMKYELEMLKQQIDELKMATRDQRQRRELHLIEENIRDKERELRLTQRKRRNVASLPVNGKAASAAAMAPCPDWDVKFLHGVEDDEDNGIANGMRELELRLQHELEDQE